MAVGKEQGLSHSVNLYSEKKTNECSEKNERIPILQNNYYKQPNNFKISVFILKIYTRMFCRNV